MSAPPDDANLAASRAEQAAIAAIARRFDPEAKVLGAAVPPSGPVPDPECRVLIHHVAKRENVGTLLRSAAAFGVREIVTGSRGKLKAFGHLGSRRHLRVVQFATLDKAVAYLKAQQFAVLGIEIDPQAVDIASRPFTGPTAFLMGNEGQGLDEHARSLCDGFVYVRQSTATTASLNVAVATSICLHHFATYAGYQEARRIGGKFV